MSIKSFFGLLFSYIVEKQNNNWKHNAQKSQDNIFNELIKKSKNTVFGKDHDFSQITSYSDFTKKVPVRDYEGISGYIEKIKEGKENVLWPKKPMYFCKTSGTTSGTKYIPITKESLHYQLKSARDAIFSYIYETKNHSIINGKMIFIQGSPALEKIGGVPVGRLSGIVALHTPFYLKSNQLPSFTTNCIEDWEEKIDSIVEETIGQNMSLISGIPPWVQMYFEKLKKKSGKKIKNLFPNFDLLIYGGVNYLPYKETFKKLIGGNVHGIELYPSSEGFIAYQDRQKKEGMLLCVNHGIFYEFISVDDFLKNLFIRKRIHEVEIGVNYVIILSTNAGLFAYNIGDTVKFVSTNPYRIIVTGRVSQFISAFGEHVIVEEVEKSLNNLAKSSSILINEFHVAPQVNPKEGLPFHEWFIEFNSNPENMSLFESTLDESMRSLNSYYCDLITGKILRPLKIRKIEVGGFKKYMISVGKLGGQNKVPRVSNDRSIADKLKKYSIK